MNTQEANQIIAEFMGTGVWVPVDNDCGELETLYSWSLDALVPVWEKLNLGIFKVFRNCTDRKHFDYQYHFKVELSPFLDKTYTGRGLEIQEAAAIATAKAIQELRNG